MKIGIISSVLRKAYVSTGSNDFTELHRHIPFAELLTEEKSLET